jgi:molecular chaperone GrpE
MTTPDHNHHSATEGTAGAPQSPGAGAVPAEERREGDVEEPLGTEREDGDGEPAGNGEASEPSPTLESLTADELNALAAKAAKADEYLSLAQRKQAEFENFRRRAARDTAAASERGATRLAKELLPAVDNLERALEHAPGDADEHGFVAGIRHVHSDLVAALRRAGIEQYSPYGEPFDPTLHEAVAQQPIEGAEPGTVVEVYQRGYRVGETVVRPARVVVAG